MRIAIVSDIHGNRTAFDAVLADLRETSPDLILHGGDLADGGASPVEIVDQIRDLGWPGVVGNVDEMLFRPEALQEFRSPLLNLNSAEALKALSRFPQTLSDAIEEMAAATREALGEERIAWLSNLPGAQFHGAMALVHASPQSFWRAPNASATDEELQTAYGRLGRPIAVYGHIHRSYVRHLPNLTVVNTGSVSLSYDGDPRAAYLLLDESEPTIRRVEYDVEQEVRALHDRGIPHADWVAKMLKTASPQMP
jgi:predicted phosphodiesterase